ncbi:MAG: YggS family pyridoxal phosphate-dependent enzyme [Gemmatimonadetes bacterium]|nr:YggS family pyridoxal phosphate-dependent enzyme [Gemmatimonadota bacterium]
MSLADNLRRIQDRIEAARTRAGRDEDVTVLAVGKGRNPAALRQALEAGLVHVGENRVQEAAGKWPDLAAEFARVGATRHMIGHLQRNKVGAALELFEVVQSVDSLRLGRKISELSHAAGRRFPVLAQVNGGREAAKHGFDPQEVDAAVAELGELPGLEIAGLMVVAPLEAPEPVLRAIFAHARASFERIGVHAAGGSAAGGNPRHLSMGMSGDYEIAVEEGSTMVRIGTALFAGP